MGIVKLLKKEESIETSSNDDSTQVSIVDQPIEKPIENPIQEKPKVKKKLQIGD